MKILLRLATALLICVQFAGAQGTYPRYTIRQLQELSDARLDSATAMDNPNLTLSPFLDDTVWVTGVVVVPPRDPVTQAPVLFTGERYRLMLQDPNEPEWGAITIVSEDTTLSKATNGIDVALIGDSISVLGRVTEFATLTQINMLHRNDAFEFHGVGTILPPRTRQVSDFMNGSPPSPTTSIYNPGEKYESELMWIRNVTIIDKPANEVFRVADAQGNVLACDDESNEIFANKDKLPPVGAVIDSMRGVMGYNSSSQFWEFFILYLSDIYVAGKLPPVIVNLPRPSVNVGPSDPVVISADITDGDGLVVAAEVHYQVNNLAPNVIPMSNVSGSTWSATIPPAGIDSAFVNYYILATDDSSNQAVLPFDTTKNRFFYFALNRPLSIRELQFTPYSDGSSGYVDHRVTVEGTITADRPDLTTVFMQDGNSPWSGVNLFFRDASDSLLRRGDRISVTGRVIEFERKTEIDSAQFTLLSSGNPIPEAVVATASDVKSGGPLAEQYEGMLLKVQNVYVVNLNADAGRNANFGEWVVNEDMNATTGLRIDDLGVAAGNVSYDNDLNFAPNGSIQLNLKDFFQSITGVLDYRNNDFKLEPRSDADFVGYTTTTVERDESIMPIRFFVHQNYPNPFNPNTTIQYEIPRWARVTVKVYNILGQEVATLVDEVQDAGGYRVTFGTQNLGSGVYLYRVMAGDLVSAKKMLLVK